jgi:hypothetical protein
MIYQPAACRCNQLLSCCSVYLFTRLSFCSYLRESFIVLVLVSLDNATDRSFSISHFLKSLLLSGELLPSVLLNQVEIIIVELLDLRSLMLLVSAVLLAGGLGLLSGLLDVLIRDNKTSELSPG